jgi:hypothetical protein
MEGETYLMYNEAVEQLRAKEYPMLQGLFSFYLCHSQVVVLTVSRYYLP